jgi:hypothetical protein
MSNLNVIINGKYLLDVFDTHTIASGNARNIFYGGMFGFFDTAAIPVEITNCTAVINEYEQLLTVTGSYASQVTAVCGGLAASVLEDNNLYNCNVLFGQTAKLNLPSTININSTSCGVVVEITSPGSVNSCSVVYNDYSIIGPDTFATWPGSIGVAPANTQPITYGSPIADSDVTDMVGPSETQNILDIYAAGFYGPKSIWLQEVLKMRQPGAVSALDLPPSTSNSSGVYSFYLAQILGSSTTASTFYRNSVVQNSMVFINLINIQTTFGVIKGSLVDYVTTYVRDGVTIAYDDSLVVNYIIPDTNGIYVLETVGVYYLFLRNGDFVTPINPDPGYNTSLNPPGCFIGSSSEDPFVPLGDTQELQPNEFITVLGVGSALLEYTTKEPVPPTPPAPSGRSGWALGLLIAGCVILGVLLLLLIAYKFDFLPSSIRNLLTPQNQMLTAIISILFVIGIVCLTLSIVLYSS